MTEIRIDHVSRWYRNVVAVNDVSMTIGPGVTGLLGPNGAGKSTLIAMMSGFLAPSTGTVTLDGEPLWRNEQVYRKLGLVPDLGASWKLPRLIGWARAQAVTMLGERIDAPTAEHWGLIWRSVPAAALADEARSTARRLADAPPGVCRAVRHTFEKAQLQDLAAQMDHERRLQGALLDKPSFDEGVRAFQEKRAPDFYR